MEHMVSDIEIKTLKILKLQWEEKGFISLSYMEGKALVISDETFQWFSRDQVLFLFVSGADKYKSLLYQ